MNIPSLKQIVSRDCFSKTVQKVNEAAKHIYTSNITETLQLTKAVILTVADAIGLKLKEKRPTKKAKRTPPWKQRMDTTVKKKKGSKPTD